MKKFTFAQSSILAAIIMLSALASTLHAQSKPGDLDPSFGSSGVVTTLITGNGAFLGNSALQADGKIVVVGGNKYSGDQYEPYVARYNTDGSLDTSFGSGGIVFTRFTIPNQTTNADNGYYNAVAVQADGKIVAAGFGASSTACCPQTVFSDAILARYTTTGALDSTFGTGGTVKTQTNTGLFQNNLNGSTTIYSLQIAPDGTIYAVGGGAFNPNGTDTSFNPIVLKYSASGGFIALNRNIVVVPAGNVGAANFGSASVLQPDGKLVFANVGGFVNNFILIRVNPDLSLDSTFGSGGVVQTVFSAGRAQANGIVLDGGKLVVSGGDNAGNNSAGNFFAARYNSNGTLDSTFASNGQLTILSSDAPLPNTRKAGGALVRQTDGKYVAAIENGFGAIRLLSNGALDASFGTGGFANYNNVGGYTGAILLQADGKIVLPGSQQDGANPNSGGVRMLRLLNPPAPSVQFSSATFNIAEGGGHLTITVTRAGDTSAASSVTYSTVDNPAAVACNDTTTAPGVAFARCDYATAVGTLNFAAGETTKSFSIPIIDDAFVEGNETFQVQLSNPSGASAGTPATATVTINDNDAAGATNPIFTTPFFVRQQYLDFLSREPEAGEPWSGVLNGCPNVNNTDPNSPSANCDRIHVSSAFFLSQEFNLKGFFVFRFYKLAFNRLPEYSEIIPDMASVTGTTTQELYDKKAAYTVAFTQRTEFANAYGSLSNTDYVAALMSRYQLTSITTPDPAAPDGTAKVTLTSGDLVSRLNAATLTRAQVLRAIADSDQVAAAEANKAFVAMQYYGYLRRTPETGGYNAWLATINANPADIRSMVNGFMNSVEYRQRFGSPN